MTAPPTTGPATTGPATTGLCRDCGATFTATPPAGHGGPAVRCPACRSPRVLLHAELPDLTIAHLDCDAFYATIEKRDDPSIADRPVIVGGRERGVVAAACYVARRYGIRSAMPMFQALRACPDAVVIKPNMEKYQAVGRQVRALMLEVTPLVQPLSIDEAFMDLSPAATGRAIGMPAEIPAAILAALARRVERELRITVSIGLSCNKFLAKIASDLDKPRGFAVIGQAEAERFLAPKPVGLLWGVGPALTRRLNGDGIATIGQLQRFGERQLVARYGSIGRHLHRFARGSDDRRVTPGGIAKSVSVETTFFEDIADLGALAAALRPLCSRLEERLRRRRLGCATIVLKLKTADFRLRTRSHTLETPTQAAAAIFRAAAPLLRREADGTRFRLLGIGAGTLVDEREADPPDLFGSAGQDATGQQRDGGRASSRSSV